MSKLLVTEIRVVDGETWETLEEFDYNTVYESLPDDWDYDTIVNELEEVTDAVNRIVGAA